MVIVCGCRFQNGLECGSDSFYGIQMRSVSCRLQNPDLIVKYNLGTPISCFDFVSSHVDPKKYMLISWFISVEIAVFSKWKINGAHWKYLETKKNTNDY
jgi:hypothetical protein